MTKQKKLITKIFAAVFAALVFACMFAPSVIIVTKITGEKTEISNISPAEIITGTMADSKDTEALAKMNEKELFAFSVKYLSDAMNWSDEKVCSLFACMLTLIAMISGLMFIFLIIWIFGWKDKLFESLTMISGIVSIINVLLLVILSLIWVSLKESIPTSTMGTITTSMQSYPYIGIGIMLVGSISATILASYSRNKIKKI